MLNYKLLIISISRKIGVNFLGIVEILIEGLNIEKGNT